MELYQRFPKYNTRDMRSYSGSNRSVDKEIYISRRGDRQKIRGPSICLVNNVLRRYANFRIDACTAKLDSSLSVIIKSGVERAHVRYNERA